MKKNLTLPPGQTMVPETEKTLRNIGEIPQIDINNWKLKIGGSVESKVAFDYDYITSLPSVKRTATMHCVERWSLPPKEYEGISTQVIKDLVKISPDAKAVMLYAADGDTTNLSLEDFFSTGAMLAYKSDGEVLTLERGYPLRFVIAGEEGGGDKEHEQYAWKWIKNIIGIDFIDKDVPGYWEERGYGFGPAGKDANPWEEQRRPDGRTIN